jgi:hypothetical protein
MPARRREKTPKGSPFRGRVDDSRAASIHPHNARLAMAVPYLRKVGYVPDPQLITGAVARLGSELALEALGRR